MLYHSIFLYSAPLSSPPLYSTPLHFSFLNSFFSIQCYTSTPLDSNFFYAIPSNTCSISNISDFLLNTSVRTGVRRSLLLGFSISALGYLLLATASSKKVVYATLFGILPLGNRCVSSTYLPDCSPAWLMSLDALCRISLHLISWHCRDGLARLSTLHFTALHCTPRMCFTVPYCTALHCTASH